MLAFTPMLLITAKFTLFKPPAPFGRSGLAFSRYLLQAVADISTGLRDTAITDRSARRCRETVRGARLEDSWR